MAKMLKVSALLVAYAEATRGQKKHGSMMPQGGWATRLGMLPFASALANAASALSPEQTRNARMEMLKLEHDEQGAQDAFKKFALDYEKAYVVHADENEDGMLTADEIHAHPEMKEHYDMRFGLFMDNVKKANMRNMKTPSETELHGITKFMDISEDEFVKNHMGLTGMESDEVQSMLADPSKKWTCSSDSSCNPSSDASSKDWRDDKVITPVKDQGQCGSCWAFGTTEAMETAALQAGIASKDDPLIGAPQELVSCDKQDFGCQGGNPITSYKWYEHHGMDLEKYWPYKSGLHGQDGKCMVKKHKGHLKVTGYKTVSGDPSTETTDMKDYMLQKNAMPIGVFANPFQTYTGGIMSADTCEGGRIDHAVQVVGLNQDGAEPYWIVRNSWNTNWGENGFIRLEYGKNTCKIAEAATDVKVAPWKKGFMESDQMMV